MRKLNRLAVPIMLALLPSSALASFHLMQIEQVIGGVAGDPSRQAIQLRMRSDGQNFLDFTRIRAWDAAGANPVVVNISPGTVSGNALGSRVLFTTSAFSSGGQGPVPDFTMTNPIPQAYLAAGRLTFEGTTGAPLWSLCWGGAGYTGPTDGQATNDPDGNYGPCFAGPLPSADLRALRFNGAAADPSSTNAADYTLTAGAATFTNNSNGSAPILEPPLFANGFEDAGFASSKRLELGPGPTVVPYDPAHDYHGH